MTLLLPHVSPATVEEMEQVTANRRNYAAMILATYGLQSYWKLNEASGNPADSKGAISGTPTAITYGATALLGAPNTDTGITFVSASSSKVAFGDNYDFTGTSPFSLECWVRPNSIGGIQSLMSKRNTNVGDGYLFHISATGRIRLQRIAAGTGTIIGDTGRVLAAGSVYHAVCTYDGTWMYTFVNGAYDNSQLSSVSIADVTTNFQLGAVNTTGTSFLNGSMGHAAVYNRALLPAEIIRHYRAGRALL